MMRAFHVAQTGINSADPTNVLPIQNLMTPDMVALYDTYENPVSATTKLQPHPRVAPVQNKNINQH
jgi:hypothetical protein